jgi:type IX secretion system PorP/SprF family membrane protein
MYDVAGTGHLSNLNLGLLYSYNIQVNNWLYVRPGLEFKYVQLGIDFFRLTFNDQLSPGGNTPPTEQPPFDQAGDIDAETSVLAYTDKVWFGTSVDHLLRPNQSLYGVADHTPIKVQVFGGAQVIRKGRLLKPIEESLSLAFLFKAQGAFKQLDFGAYWYKSPLMFGFWYRGLPLFHDHFDRDAMIILVGYKTKELHIGYSYDFTISRLIMATGGAHEISFMYEFRTNQKMRRKIHAIPCPEF